MYILSDKKYTIHGPFIPDRIYFFTLKVETDSKSQESVTTNQTVRITSHSGISLTIKWVYK